MPVSKEELLKDLDTPEYQTLIKEALTKKEFVIQDKTEHQSYLDRYKNDVLEKELPNRIKTIYDNIDKDVKETFGVDRDPNEKTYEYLKRAGKTKLSALEQSQQKIRELEEAISKGDGTAAMKRKLEEEQANFQRELKKREDKIRELEQNHSIVQKTADVKLLYGELKKGFIKQLPPLFARAEAAALDEAIRNSVAQDGKLYMANADGSIRKDSSYNEISVEDFLKAEFKDVIETQRKAGGAGSEGGKGDPKDPKDITDENFPMKSDIKNKRELTDYMLSLGIKQGTEQFRKIWVKYGLPMQEA
jgi:flagellar hook-basal body complex protein FliE